MTYRAGTESVEAFRRDGACVLRRPFTGWIETLRKGVARNLAEPRAVMDAPEFPLLAG